MDVITSPAASSIGEAISQIFEAIIEVVLASKNVLIDKKSFAELSSYLDRLRPILKEFSKKSFSDSEALNNVVEILDRETRAAKQLISECSERNRFYLLIKCRSITKRIQKITSEISYALSCIPLAAFDISSGIREDIELLIDNMRTAEFRTAIAEEEILEKIDSAIQDRNIDRSYANNLLLSIAKALGIPIEQSELKKELEEFKREIEGARLRKDQAEAFHMDQIAALLERADAASSREDKEKKYLTKRKSVGSQILEPLQSFYCPINKEVMVDPVETPSGQTFERSAIEKWLKEENLCPLTLTPLDISMLRPNKTLRQAIEEWRDKNTFILIGSMKSKLSSTEDEEILHCLGQLKILCEQKEIYREWLLMDEYVPYLIKLLQVKNRDIRSNTLVILSILAKDSDDAKERIAKEDDAIESIVRSLGRRIGERKVAVALLLELSKIEFVRDCIAKVQGCILLLVNLSNNDDNQAARDARDVLENLSFSNDNVILMAESNYFKYLLQQLSSGPEEVKLMMAESLGKMKLSDHNKLLLIKDGILNSLFSLLSHGNIRMKEVALEALMNLSSDPKNGQEMIRQGGVHLLSDILFNHTSSQDVQNLAAATLMHLALSTVKGTCTTQISMFESDEDIYKLFSLIKLRGPNIQKDILQSLHALCRSSSAAKVKNSLIECSAEQELIQLCENNNLSIRANAVKLLYCLAEDCDEAGILDHIGLESAETLVRIVKTSNDDEEIVSAMGIISNLPRNLQICKGLLESGTLDTILNFLLNGRHNTSNNHLIENAIGVLCQLTTPEKLQLQKQAAQAGIISVTVQMLEVGSSLTKKRASICLAQFSESSHGLSRPLPKRQKFWCFSALPEAGCPVHPGICTVQSSFCLVEAAAVAPLVSVLRDPDPGACEASLDALLTLTKGERWQSGMKVLDQANAIPAIIRLLHSPSPQLQEKVLSTLERIFELLDLKQKHGPSAQMHLVDLTQKGSSSIKSFAARILAQLNVLHEQSSYF